MKAPPYAKYRIPWLLKLLAAGTIYTLPLVSVPFLPFVRASAVAPAVIIFAGPLLALTFLIRPRSRTASSVDFGLALATLATIMVSWVVALLDLEAYSASNLAIMTRIVRAVLPLLTASVVYTAFREIMRLPGLGPKFLARHIVRSGAIYALVGVMSLATAHRAPIVGDAYRVLRNLLTTSGENPIGGLNRVTGLTFEPSFAGFEYVGWWLPIAVGLALSRRTRTLGIALGLCFVVAAFGTQSLTAFISLGALIVAAIVVSLRRVKSWAVAGILMTLGLLLLVPISGIPTFSKVFNRVAVQVPDLLSGDLLSRGPRDPSLSERAALQHNAVNVALKYPLVGAGFGLAGYRFEEYRPAWTYKNPYMQMYERYLSQPDGSVFPSAKNLYVRIWSETGLSGLILLLAFIGLGFVRAGKASKRGRAFRGADWLGAATVMGLIASSVAYLSLDSFGIPYLWAWLGIASGAYSR